MTTICFTDRGKALASNAWSGQVYTSLENDEVRTLLLAPGKKHQSIVCELEVVANSKASQFEALSYVWGSSKPNKTVQCNGVTFRITDSLYTALSHLRYPLSWRRLWVDQLCIDQSKAHELRSQVRHMGSLFSHACRVIVWLGAQDNRLASAWKLITDTSRSESLVRSDFLDSSPSSTPAKRPSSLRTSSSASSSRSRRSLSLRSSTDTLVSAKSSNTSMKHTSRRSDRDSPNLKNALRIFQHEYFTRTWTFQEIVVSRAAIICSGDVEIAWSDLASWYFHYAAKLRPSSLLYDSMGAFENIMNVRSELDKQAEGAEDKMKLSELLMLTRQRDSLKAEDRVYALLGLLPRFSKHLTAISEEEGWLPIPELFLTAFKYCLEAENDLAVLSAAGMYNGNKNFRLWPTWLPDWRQQLPLRPLVLSTPHASNEEEETSCQHDSTIRPAYSIFESKDGMFRMRVQGFRIGVAITRHGSWPGCFLAANCRTQSILDLQIPNVHAQRMTAIFSADLFQCGDQFASKIYESAFAQDEFCEPLRTSAAVSTGDWICALFGGRTLYALRPVAKEGSRSRDQAHRISGTQPDDTSSTKCCFVGECTINTLAPRQLMEHKDYERHEFGLV